MKKEIMALFNGAGRFERGFGDAVGIQARQNGRNGSVFSGSVHGLEHKNQAFLFISIQLLL